VAIANSRLIARDERDGADNEHTPGCVYQCKSCGAPMFIIETFTADHAPRAPPIGQP